MDEKNHRIAYALHLEDWSFEKGDPKKLEKYGKSITPEEFDLSMKGNIYCPKCHTPLSRSPEDTSISKKNVTAHFKHKPSYKDVYCILKTKRGKGLSYGSEKEVNQAIEDNSLSNIYDWMENPPSLDDDITENDQIDQGTIEDIQGPKTDVPIGRHNGKKVKIPSVLSTVAALCIGFNKNLHKAYYFPKSQTPILLPDALFDLRRITKSTPRSEKLFFGRISDYRRLNRRNVIHIDHPTLGEYKVYTWPEHDERKGINDSKIGQHILFYSNFEWESETIPRSKLEKWGQYALLPQKYDKYLEMFKYNPEQN